MRLSNAYKYLFENREKLTTPIILSLIAHLLTFSFFIYWTHFISHEKPKLEVVEVFPLKDENVYQLADIEPPEVEKRPLKSKFIGMYDSTVEKETVSLARKSGRDGGDGKKRQSGSKGEGKEKSDILKPQVGDVVMGNVRATPDAGDFHDSIGDFFPDYHFGTKTYLNVKKFEDVAYFVRMKRVFRMTCNPYSVVERAGSLGQLNMGQLVTIVGIGVDETGELDELFIIKKSGIAEYDQEILRTVRASSPFATPPKKFTDDDGKLRVSWSFIFYL